MKNELQNIDCSEKKVLEVFNKYNGASYGDLIEIIAKQEEIIECLREDIKYWSKDD